MILKVEKRPFSNIYFENLFNHDDIDWTAIYTLTRIVTHNTKSQIIPHILIKTSYFCGIKSYPLCCFCNLNDETPFYKFYECDRLKCLWSSLVQCFQNTLILTSLIPKTAIIGIPDSVNINSFFENNKIFINHILLIFKLYIYKSREEKFINMNNLKAEICQVERIEK